MIRNSLYKVVVVLILLIAATALLGEVTVAATNVGTSAADFLLIGYGARAASLGGAFTAVSNGASAGYWNPAGLTSLEGGEVTLGHFSWLQDISVEQAAIGFPLRDGLVAGVSLTYVNYGTIDGYDANGLATGQLTAYDYAAGVSLGFNLMESLSLGVTSKYISQRLDDVSASSMAFDVGAKFELESFALAASVVNVGSRMQFDRVSEDLPSAARLGISFVPFADGLLTSIEVEHRFNGDLLIRQGLELGFSERYFLRTGYDYMPGQNERWLATRIAVGGGLKLDAAAIDYSFTPNDKSTTEDIHRFTVSYSFGN
jgi:hypothetical protein